MSPAVARNVNPGESWSAFAAAVHESSGLRDLEEMRSWVMPGSRRGRGSAAFEAARPSSAEMTRAGFGRERRRVA
jgi:hypothetical protein